MPMSHSAKFSCGRICVKTSSMGSLCAEDVRTAAYKSKSYWRGINVCISRETRRELVRMRRMIVLLLISGFVWRVGVETYLQSW
jgi:hypothetical protein